MRGESSQTLILQKVRTSPPFAHLLNAGAVQRVKCFLSIAILLPLPGEDQYSVCWSNKSSCC